MVVKKSFIYIIQTCRFSCNKQNGNQKSRGIVMTPCHADVVDGEFPSALYQRLVRSTVVSSERNISNRKQIKVTVKPC
ncbi:hypothetical protein VN97_g3506 [Penicillium thymicola]|uniref:Uncharacterized protein n=1 Tax=Penicillium thymicola TaxID=293382 RepID=A0AAI9XAH6_PENTH|nr:hypothetical protein VN97_g3506 [Penicillium thymicola]